MVHCVAPGCINRHSPKRNVTYFGFPNPSKNPDLCKAWITAIGIQNFKPNGQTCVCELHFGEDDFDETYKMKKLLMPNDYFRPILKQVAVPKFQLREVGSLKEESDQNIEILKELLGEPYVIWKNTAQQRIKKVTKTKKVRKDIHKYNLKDSKEDQDVEKEKKFDIINDYILKKPLKPLPDQLQRIIPKILSVVIKEDKISPSLSKIEEFRRNLKEKTLHLSTSAEKFLCCQPISATNFYCCKLCQFTTYFKVNLFKHTTTAHQPINYQGILRLPMKMYKYKEHREYICFKCKFSTFSKLLLTRHALKTKEYRLLDQIGAKWFSCEYCSYKCRGFSIRQHMFSKHNENFLI